MKGQLDKFSKIILVLVLIFLWTISKKKPAVTERTELYQPVPHRYKSYDKNKSKNKNSQINPKQYKQHPKRKSSQLHSDPRSLVAESDLPQIEPIEIPKYRHPKTFQSQQERFKTYQRVCEKFLQQNPNPEFFNVTKQADKINFIGSSGFSGALRGLFLGGRVLFGFFQGLARTLFSRTPAIRKNPFYSYFNDDDFRRGFHGIMPLTDNVHHQNSSHSFSLSLCASPKCGSSSWKVFYEAIHNNITIQQAAQNINSEADLPYSA